MNTKRHAHTHHTPMCLNVLIWSAIFFLSFSIQYNYIIQNRKNKLDISSKSANDKCFQIFLLLAKPHMKSTVKCLTFTWSKFTVGSIFCDVILFVCFFRSFCSNDTTKTSALYQKIAESLSSIWYMACCVSQTIPTDNFQPNEFKF